VIVSDGQTLSALCTGKPGQGCTLPAEWYVPKMLTRSGVAKRIRKSLATVRRMEGNELHPEVDENGVHWFDEDEVDQVAKGRGGRRPVIPTRCQRDGSISPEARATA
jgi:hypothetical protein